MSRTAENAKTVRHRLLKVVVTAPILPKPIKADDAHMTARANIHRNIGQLRDNQPRFKAVNIAMLHPAFKFRQGFDEFGSMFGECPGDSAARA